MTDRSAEPRNEGRREQAGMSLMRARPTANAAALEELKHEIAALSTQVAGQPDPLTRQDLEDWGTRFLERVDQAAAGRTEPLTKEELRSGMTSCTKFTGFDEAVVVHIETTGVNPAYDRITSIAMVRANFGSFRNDPQELRANTADATFRFGRPSKATAIELREFIGDLPIIAHGASSVLDFLNAEFDQAGVDTLARNRSICTARRSPPALIPDGVRQDNDIAGTLQAMDLAVRRRGLRLTNTVADAHLVFAAAAFLYKTDNGIPMPGYDPEDGLSYADHRSNRPWPFNMFDRPGDAFIFAGFIILLVVIAWPN